MESKEIILNNQVVQYTLYRKDIKKCYLKIVSGKVIVSAGYAYTSQDIETLIRTHQSLVLEKVNSYKSKAVYKEQGYVYIFNKRYSIILEDLKMRRIRCKEDTIYVYHQNMEPIIEKYLKTLLLEYVTSKIEMWLQSMFSFSMPTLKIQKVKSRWGACMKTKNEISFTLSLVHLDTDLIDYVIMHELCHMLQPNHSPLFYQELALRMPDYKQREKRLKEESI